MLNLNKKSLFVPILLVIASFAFSFNLSSAEEIGGNLVTENLVQTEEVLITQISEDTSVTTPSEENTEATVVGEVLSTSTEETPVVTEKSSSETTTSESQSASVIVAPVVAPALTTDKDDYHPGETATIFGNFFTPLQNFVLKVFGSDENNQNYTEQIETVSTDSNGSFSFSYLLDNLYRPFYEVVVSTLSGDKVAETWFRDSAIGTYDQCSNDDGDGYASGDTGCRWINGNINGQNSTYQEGDSTVQRLWLRGYEPGETHTITFQYGTTKGGKHAYDFLTAYDWSENIVEADLCQGITNCVGTNPVLGSIPTDVNAQGFDLLVPNRNIEVRGAKPGSVSVSIKPFTGSYSGDSETQVDVSFVVDDVDDPTDDMCTTNSNIPSCDIAIFFGAHIAKTSDWVNIGGQTGATTIPGSPYHVSLAAEDGASIGNRDNQMQASAIPATITIIKQTVGGDGTFDFTTTGGNGLASNFSIITNNSTGLSNAYSITKKGTYTVTEGALGAGWSLTSISCDDPTSNSSVNVGTKTATINLADGESVVCTFTNTKQQNGTIIVDKVTNPSGDSQSFSFDAVGGNYQGFNLTDAANPNNQELVAGNYSVSETPVAGWTQTSASCVSSLGYSETIGNLSLQAGETITCTFTNTKLGHIIVDKVTVPGGDTQSFNFDANGGSYGDFSLTDGSAVNDQGLVPDQYTVTENPPTGWALTGLVCDGDSTESINGSGTATINLAAGQTVNCTFINTKLGTIIIEKQTLPNGSSQSFNFTRNFGSDFALTDGQQNSTSNLVPGTYSVDELTPAGWDETSAVCSDQSPVTAISLQAGETVTCVFTNTADSKIIVQKITVGGDANFFFSSQYDPDGWTLSNGQSNNSGDIDAGTYLINETVPDGWDLTSATCDNGDDPSAVTVAPGETVTCTFTNTQRGHIIIEKQTLPDGSNQSFEFDSNYGINFNLVDGGQNDSGALVPGTYSVDELTPAGWDETSAVCSDQSPVTAISLQAGETVTCVFTNTQRGNIVIVKDVIGNPDPTDFTFTNNFGNGNPASFMLDEDGNADLPSSRTFAVLPGTYNVAETALPHWQLEETSCDDGSLVSAISVAPGETVTCTFVNEELNKITLIKNTVGGNGEFTFDLTGTGLAGQEILVVTNGTQSHVFEDIDQDNTYSITEVVPAGWELMSAVCTGGNTPANITPEPGEDVTCTFTNGKLPTLTLQKTVIKDNGGTAVDTDWTLSASGPTPISGVDGNANVTNKIVNVGSYDLSESNGPTGYTASAWVCTGATQNDGDTVTLAAGENATCTITNNDDAPSLTLIKHVVKDNGGTAVPTDWTLTATGYDTASPDAGSYNLSEIGPDGYTMTSLTCDNAQGQVTSVTLGLGEDVTCTFVNDDIAPQLHLRKVVINDNGGTATVDDFTLTADGTGANDLSGTSPVDSGATLKADTWALSETSVPGYTASTWSCVGGNQNGANITIGIGGEATCTITNDDISPELTVIKHVINDEDGTKVAGDFTMNVTGTNVSDPSFPGAENPGITVTLDAGNYSVDESDDFGYTKTIGNNCSGTIAVGEKKTCIITNDDVNILPTVTVEKTVNPITLPEPGGNATFSVLVTNTSNEPVVLTSLVDDIYGDLNGQGTCVTGGVIAANGGTYSCSFSGAVSGDAGSLHTDIVTVVVTDDEDTTATDNDDAVVTLTDVKPEIEVTKTAGVTSISEPGGNVTYTFTVKNLSTVESVIIDSLSDNKFGVLAGDVDCQVGTSLAIGATCTFEATFSIAGDAGDSHINVFQACAKDNENNEDCDNDDSTVKFVGARISIDPLTATNDVNDAHTFTVLVEQNDGSGWVVAPNEDVDFSMVDAGTTSVLDAVASTCDDAGANTDLSGECTLVFNSATPGTITVNAEVTVTIDSVVMHRKTDGTLGSSGEAVKTYVAGKIIVVKQTLPDGSIQSFEFNPSWSVSNFNLKDGESNNSDWIAPGNYDVSETIPEGWDQTSAVCDDGSLVSAINLAAGETVTCTFTNTQRGHLIVDKVTDPAGDMTSFSINTAGTGTITGGGAGSITDATNQDYEVTPGMYSVTETIPTGWEKTGDDCQNVSVGAGETKTCTITNTKLGSLEIVKNSDPDDEQDIQFITNGVGLSNFTLDDDNGFDNAYQNNTTFNDLVPGAYTVNETIPNAYWTLQSIICTDVDSGQPYTNITTTGTGVTVNLTAGKNVSCTFLNHKESPTRTQGFWQTHTDTTSLVFALPAMQKYIGFNGPTTTATHKGIITNNQLPGQSQLFGAFFANIAQKTTSKGKNAQRTPVDKARMQLLQQLVAAKLNCAAFGCSVGVQVNINAADAAYAAGDVNAILNYVGIMDAYNNSGDTLAIPSIAQSKATPSQSKLLADLKFWDTP